MAESESKPAEKSEGTAASTEGSSSATETKAEAKPETKPESKADAKPAEKPAPKAASKPAEKTGGKRRAEPDKDGDKKAVASTTVNKVRGYVATAVWVLAVLAAVILAVGALVITLDFNKDNPIVHFFVTTANNLDLGVFKDFKPGKNESAHDALVKRVLVNWGIAAVIYLVVGKVLERLIRP